MLTREQIQKRYIEIARRVFQLDLSSREKTLIHWLAVQLQLTEEQVRKVWHNEVH
jgi:hypothetical protein